MTDTPTLQWFQSHETLVEVGHFLVDTKFFSATELLYFFEKPWKYEDEWTDFVAWRAEQAS